MIVLACAGEHKGDGDMCDGHLHRLQDACLPPGASAGTGGGQLQPEFRRVCSQALVRADRNTPTAVTVGRLLGLAQWNDAFPSMHNRVTGRKLCISRFSDPVPVHGWAGITCGTDIVFRASWCRCRLGPACRRGGCRAYDQAQSPAAGKMNTPRGPTPNTRSRWCYGELKRKASQCSA